MELSKGVSLIGDALVFGVMGGLHSGLVYKVDLCEVMAGGDYRLATCFDPKQGWFPMVFKRREYDQLMVELEEHAYRLAPTKARAWALALSYALNAGVSESERLKALVQRVMSQYGVPQKAVAERLGIRRQTLQEYCDGKTTGTMGAALILALEALLARPSFD